MYEAEEGGKSGVEDHTDSGGGGAAEDVAGTAGGREPHASIEAAAG
jgi:hypothetical protein